MSVLNLSDVFNKYFGRIDAEFYSKKYIILENNLLRHKINLLDDLADITDGEHGSPDLDENSNILYLSGNNIKENYIDLTNIKYCTERLHRKNKRSELVKENVLMSIVGTVGKASVIYEDLYGNTDRNVATIKNIEKVNPYFLSIFLNSKYGNYQTERFSTGNVQPLLNLLQVKSIIIPLFDEEFQINIEAIFKNSYSKRKLSQQKYTEAENLLLETLNLKDFQPNNEAVNIKTLKESFLQTGRLDAEFYQKKYEEIEQKIQNYIEGYAPLGKVCTLKDTNFTPNDNTEYAYIELSNIGNSGEITGCTREMGINLPTRARRKVSENDVIVSSIEGSLKSCAIISKEYHNALCSTGFYVVASEQINAETLLVLFKSELMQQILKKNCSGTILTAINKEEFLNIPIPIIGKKYQEQIAEYIQKANQLRTEAQSLLQEAKLSVESAIESQLSENQNISGGGVSRLNSIDYKILYYERLAQWTLYEALFGLAENRFSHLSISVQTLQNSFVKTGRLDAEYYQPKYERLIQKLKNHTCEKLKNVVDIKKSIEPGSIAYDTEGMPFIRVSDYSKFGLSTPDKYLSETYYRENQKTLDRLKPKKDTILFSKDGSVGIAYQLTEDLQGITSGAILHLQVKNKKEILPEYLTLVLNSLVVQMQADRDVGGSIIQHWRVNEIEEVIIPIVDKDIQQKIALLVQESFTLKQESEKLLQQAKQMVEAEIEKRIHS